MAKKKHFITQKMINTIIQKYGGGHKWSLREDISEHSIVTYTDIKGRMLTINLMWEGKQGQFTYIEVHITTTDGIIYRRDRYDFKDTEYKVIEFVYTEENGHYYETFRKVGETMARATKESKIKELEKRLEEMTGYYEQVTKRNAEMAERGEESFLNSPTYYQMQEQLDFYKRIADLNQMHIDSQKKWGYRQADKVQQVYEDNKRLMEQAGEEYHIGCMVREETEYERLREEIRELKGALDGKNLNLVARDKMIADMMIQIADLRAENKALKKSDVDIEAEPRLDSTEDKFTQIQRLSKNIVTLKHKLSTLRADLKREMQRKYDNYSESDEMSYTALLSVNKVMEHLLEESNATHDRLVEEIKSLQEQLKGATTAPSEQGSEELQQEIAELREKLRLTEGQCKVLEANKQKLIERKEKLNKLLGEANQKISEYESQMKSIYLRNSEPDLLTLYHALEDRYNNNLASVKKTREEIKSLKATVKELQERLTTTAPLPTEEPGEDTTPQSVGRPKTDDEKIQKVLQMRKDGIAMRTISKELGISLGTVSNIVKKYGE